MRARCFSYCKGGKRRGAVVGRYVFVSFPRLPCEGESRPLKGCKLLIFSWWRGKLRQLAFVLSGQCSRFKVQDGRSVWLLGYEGPARIISTHPLDRDWYYR